MIFYKMFTSVLTILFLCLKSALNTSLYIAYWFESLIKFYLWMQIYPNKLPRFPNKFGIYFSQCMKCILFFLFIFKYLSIRAKLLCPNLTEIFAVRLLQKCKSFTWNSLAFPQIVPCDYWSAFYLLWDTNVHSMFVQSYFWEVPSLTCTVHTKVPAAFHR